MGTYLMIIKVWVMPEFMNKEQIVGIFAHDHVFVLNPDSRSFTHFHADICLLVQWEMKDFVKGSDRLV
jgi:hypothetical protein